MRTYPAGVVALLFTLGTSGCRDRQPARKADVTPQGTPRPGGPHPFADTGRVIDQGLSVYAVIADTACPGRRTVTTRFETSQDLIIRLTERTTTRDCQEGSLDDFTAMVHTRDGALVDSIHGYASSLGVIDIRDAIGDPLLTGNEYPGGSGRNDSEYWNLRTGKPVFRGDGRLKWFAANGKVRYLIAAGGDGDTLGIVEYGDARGKPQRVVFMRDSLPGVRSQSQFEVDRDTLEGPISDRHVAIGSKDDTIPVSGVTLRFRVSDVFLERGLVEYNLSAAIVDDRLVALPFKR